MPRLVETWGNGPYPINLFSADSLTAEGETITILGSGFFGVSSVLFGNVSASFAVVNGTQLTAVVPAGVDLSADVLISVVGQYGTGTLLMSGGLVDDGSIWFAVL